MRILAALALAACYSPRAPAGAPCDPTSPSCPTGQACLAQANGSFCDIASDAPAARDAPADTAVDAGPDAPPDAQTQFIYAPNIAACINPLAPDPAACATASGTNGVRVDAADVGHPWDTFLRFHLDTAFTGRTVTSVRLQMTASDDMNADSPNTGSVYESVAFSMADLSSAEPAKASATALAGSQGAVTQLQTIEWPLPTTLVTPGASVFLELENASTDAAIYWNASGTTPPKLVIDVQ